MKRIIKTAFVLTLAAFATQTFAQTTTTNISPQERSQIEEIVHQYLIKKPEVLVEAMQVLQRKQMDEAQQMIQSTQKDATKYADMLFHQSTDPTAGNPNGKISVVEFFDYQCPHCVDMAPVISDILKSNPNVRIVFKEFPIRGPMSELASRAALAANLQGKYYELNHALLTSTKQLTPDVIYQLAKDSGIDVDKLKKDMDSDSIQKQLKGNLLLAQNLKLFGTPAFFIAKSDVANNKGTITYIPGQLTQQQLDDEIGKASK